MNWRRSNSQNESNCFSFVWPGVIRPDGPNGGSKLPVSKIGFEWALIMVNPEIMNSTKSAKRCVTKKRLNAFPTAIQLIPTVFPIVWELRPLALKVKFSPYYRNLQPMFDGKKYIIECPCGSECVDGCIECENPICECSVSFMQFCCFIGLKNGVFRMLHWTKTGTIAWMVMVRVLHGVFIIVQMTSLVKPTALGNSKQKLMIAPVRFVKNYAIIKIRNDII